VIAGTEKNRAIFHFGSGLDMSSQSAARQRVVALLNAISNLDQGDLHRVLNLDAASLYDPEIHGEGVGTEALNFRGDLGRLCEEHLIAVMVYGEVRLDSRQKRGRARKALGGRYWS